MSKQHDVIPTDELLDRWMNPIQARALRRFAEAEGLDEDTIKSLAQISGRGWRHPYSVEGWRKVWPMLQPWLALAKETKEEE